MVANINDVRVSSPINRYQQISQAEGKIDKEIKARENYITSIDNDIGLRREYISSLVSSRDEHIEQRKLLAESREINSKRMLITQESIDINKKKIELLEENNRLLLGLLEKRGFKVDNNDITTNSKELTLLNAKVERLENRENSLKEKSINLDTKLDKLALKVDHTEKQAAKLENKIEDKPQNPTINDNSKNTDEYKNNIRALGKSLTYTSISRAPSTMPKVQGFENEYTNFHLLNKDLAPKIEKNIEEIKANKSILENYNKGLSNHAIGSRQEEDKIGQIIDRISFLENENKEYLSSIRKAKSQYMDLIKNSVTAKQYTNELIKSGSIKEAQDVCNNIISSKAKDVNSPIVDKNYVPSDEKLRSAASEVMKLQDMFGSKIRSNENLVSSYISAFSEGRASVTKDEVLNMLQNAFVYTNISLKALDKII